MPPAEKVSLTGHLRTLAQPTSVPPDSVLELASACVRRFVASDLAGLLLELRQHPVDVKCRLVDAQDLPAEAQPTDDEASAAGSTVKEDSAARVGHALARIVALWLFASLLFVILILAIRL
jgi:hypothetical protein